MAKYPISRERKWHSKDTRIVKHKLLVGGGSIEEGRANPYFNKVVFKSVRSVVLQQLLYVNILLERNDSWLHRILADRYKDYHTKRKDGRALRDANFRTITDDDEGKEREVDSIMVCDLIKFLGYQDIMEVLGCSRRTAAEYKSALQSIHDYYYYELMMVW